MLYALGGVSGSGKTWLRENHPRLQGLPVLDIANVYAAARRNGEELDWLQALERFEAAVRSALQRGHTELVLEAFFKPGGEQRRRIEALAAEYWLAVGFIWCAAPRQACWHRCFNDTSSNTPQRQRARLEFIHNAEERWFEPIAGETARDVFSRSNTSSSASTRPPQQDVLYVRGVAAGVDDAQRPVTS